VSPTLKNRIRRFSPAQRLFHLLLMLSFLVQSATGFSRMYMETAWGKALGRMFGGYESALTIHIYVGIFMLCAFVAHAAYLVGRIDWKNFPACLFSPDTILPHPGDLKQFFQHIGWFFGMARPPRFDRWGYWEKFDYWAVFWGMVIIGTTGLLLAFPLAACRIMPGWGLNVAFWVHRIEALLAIGHVFVIHFFIGHLRRHHFPMDLAMFEGSVDLNGTRQEKPRWVDRLETGGNLEGLLVADVEKRRRVVYYLVGYAALSAGVLLLIGALLNLPAITW
jgi:cytochrome b subunit of formate dehydrogenase